MAQRRVFYIPALAPVAPVGVLVSGSQVISESSNTITEKTMITNGPAGGTVTFQCTAIGGSNYPGSQYLYVYGPNTTMSLGSTFTINLDAAGNGSFNTICYAGTPPPNGGFHATLQIVAVSSGVIGPYASKSYSHTTGL